MHRLKIRLRQLSAIVEGDIRKLRHDPYELLVRMVQPAIWLLIFGQAMASTKAIPTGDLSYLDFLFPGVLAQTILFVSIFYGVAVIWERDMGILQKILVSPAPRYILVVGRSIAGGLRCLSQMVFIYILALLLGISIRLGPLPLMGVVATVFLGGALFSTLSLVLASIVKKRERFMGVGQMLGMPLFFASNALYPIEIMPHWLQVISVLNPLTYQVKALRSFMITGSSSGLDLSVDFAIAFFTLVVLVAIATKTYPRIID